VPSAAGPAILTSRQAYPPEGAEGETVAPPKIAIATVPPLPNSNVILGLPTAGMLYVTMLDPGLSVKSPSLSVSALSCHFIPPEAPGNGQLTPNPGAAAGFQIAISAPL
jgi:hypothetical protein